jgi:hypothetical protein
MIRTSYFAQIKNLLDKGYIPEDFISIARGKPKFYDGDEYPDLFPSWELIMGSKNGTISEEEYTEKYLNYLNTLNKEKIKADLEDKVLLCWCKKGKFCHRHIVSKWLQNKESEI